MRASHQRSPKPCVPQTTTTIAGHSADTAPTPSTTTTTTGIATGASTSHVGPSNSVDKYCECTLIAQARIPEQGYRQPRAPFNDGDGNGNGGVPLRRNPEPHATLKTTTAAGHSADRRGAEPRESPHRIPSAFQAIPPSPSSPGPQSLNPQVMCPALFLHTPLPSNLDSLSGCGSVKCPHSFFDFSSTPLYGLWRAHHNAQIPKQTTPRAGPDPAARHPRWQRRQQPPWLRADSPFTTSPTQHPSSPVLPPPSPFTQAFYLAAAACATVFRLIRCLIRTISLLPRGQGCWLALYTLLVQKWDQGHLILSKG